MGLSHAAKRAILGPALVAAFGGAAAAEAPPEGLALTYVCDGGAMLQVAYLNPPEGGSFAVVAHAGRLVPMRAGPTGSGVRYQALDGSGLVWHAKGQGGVLLGLDGAALASGCAAPAR